MEDVLKLMKLEQVLQKIDTQTIFAKMFNFGLVLGNAVC